MCRIVEYAGRKLLDGGVMNSIPIDKSVADGNDFHVIVLTRNRGFVKEPMGHERAVRAFYRKYPKVADALATRHEVYNRQLALCEQLERDGKALIIRPQKPVDNSRTSSDIPALLALHDEGVAVGRAATAHLLQTLK
jgi:predicted patatin/cPLA2 family phospholipase